MKNKFKKSGGMKFLLVSSFWILLILPSVMALEASFDVTSFSCTPSESVISEVFSCTAQIKNNGDYTGSVGVATLYPDSNNWLEESNYPQASGSSVGAGNSVEITFTGLRATKSGSNGFDRIMLDNKEDRYVSNNNVKVNVINVVVTVDNSVSSAVMGTSWTSEAEVTAGGNIDVDLTFAVNSGGCSIGSQANPKSISGMTDGSKQARTWTVTQGTTSGNCRYTISAAATGNSGIASKIDSTSSTITCSDCPEDSGSSSSSSSSSSSGGGSGSSSSSSGSSSTGGEGTTVSSIEELPSTYITSIASGENIEFGYDGLMHYLSVMELTETTAKIILESEQQTFVLTVGDKINADLTGDELAEISIRLDSINIITNKAKFTLKRLTETVAADKSIESEEKTKEEIVKIGSIWFWVIGGVIIVGGIIGAIVLRGKTSNQYINRNKLKDKVKVLDNKLNPNKIVIVKGKKGKGKKK